MTTDQSIEQALGALKQAVKDVRQQCYVQAHMNLETAIAALEGRPYGMDRQAIRERIADLSKQLDHDRPQATT
jgi:bisphosphoglycerate-independent phosphoglycerate mutase (AlkP superfamily)